MNKPVVEVVRHTFSRYLELLKSLQTFRGTRRRRVYMSFVRTAVGWRCRFHADDLQKTPISRQFVFRTAEKILEAARRGEGLTVEPARQALDQAVSLGRGGLWLHLTSRQYSALVSASSHPRET